MAANESKIRFKLNSDYDGKGFQQVNADISKTSKNVARTAGGVEKLGHAASMLPGKFGEIAASGTGVANVFKNLLQGIGNLGPIGLAAAAVGSLFAGIKIGMDRAEKRAKEAKERIARHAEAMKVAIASRLNWLRNKMDDDFDAMKEGVNGAISAFDKLIGRINKVNSAKAEVKVAEAQNRAALRSANKSAQLLGIANDDDRAVLEAQLNLQEALDERTEIEKQNAENEKQAARTLKQAQERRSVLEQNIAVIKQAVAKAEEDAAAAAKTGTKEMKPFYDRVKKTKDELAKAEEALVEQDTSIAIAQENMKAAAIKNESALIANEQKILDLNASMDRLRAAQEKAAQAEERNAKITSLKNEKLKTQANAEKQVADIEKQIEQSKNRIKDIQKAQDRTRAGMAKDREKHQGISGRGFNYETDENGNVADLAGWDRAQRYAARADRDAQRANRAAAANEREYDKLRNKLENGDKLTDQEMKKYDKLDKWMNERKGKKREEDNIQNLEDNKKQIMEDMKTTIKNIEQKIENLTAK